MRFGLRLRRPVGLAAGVAVLLGPISVPLLHAAERPGEVRVEASHDGDRCQVLHHHLACIQLHSSAARPEPGPDMPGPDAPREDAAASEAPVLPRTQSSHDPFLPRAPPRNPPRV